MAQSTKDHIDQERAAQMRRLLEEKDETAFRQHFGEQAFGSDEHEEARGKCLNCGLPLPERVRRMPETLRQHLLDIKAGGPKHLAHECYQHDDFGL
ncbi:hypothetical protein [Brachybacterium hainanense]|uniref:HNH endonuclease n=1 Tax=Brachybacterium hainanense TaxID=1541174 RepID=A0ABV6RC39_9MICO